MTYRASWRHERTLRRPKREDRRSAKARYGQEPSRPHLLREPLIGQALRQTRTGGPIAGAQEQARLQAKARRALQEAAPSGSRGAPLSHPAREVRVPAGGSIRGGQPLHLVPSHKADGRDQEKGGRSAQERDEFLRATWRVLVAEVLDPGKLVFVDECGTHTSLAPVYGSSPKGERLKLSVPRKRGKNTTLLASITLEGMGPSLAVEGSTTKEVFEAYLEHVLLPELQKGQVVVMDSLPAHKPKRVRELIERRGCQLLYLPGYSPDYNPTLRRLSRR